MVFKRNLQIALNNTGSWKSCLLEVLDAGGWPGGWSYHWFGSCRIVGGRYPFCLSGEKGLLSPSTDTFFLTPSPLRLGLLSCTVFYLFSKFPILNNLRWDDETASGSQNHVGFYRDVSSLLFSKTVLS